MDNLLKLREEKRLCQQKLADKLGLSQQSIYKYEKGLAEPDISTLKAMAVIFDTSVDYLIGHTHLRHKIETVEKYDLNALEGKLMDNFRKLSNNLQNHFEGIIAEITKD